MKRKTQAAIVVAVTIVLAAAVVALAQMNRPHVAVEPGTIAVTRAGKTLKVFTLAQVKELPSVQAKKTIRSSSHPSETGTFTGVPLRELLDDVDPALLKSASQVVTRATDGYVAALAADEVSTGSNVLLAYAKNGKGLGTSRDGGTGPFRIIILTDPFGNRCTKWVNQIELLK
jgi:DMSO/TMAO reductase YedYZ molybdopterin-dependent catalytic subunit